MKDILFWMMTISIIVCLPLIGAVAANFSNIFKKEKEDNIIFNAISWPARWLLMKFRIRVTYFRVALTSYFLGAAIISLNVIVGFTLG